MHDEFVVRLKERLGKSQAYLYDKTHGARSPYIGVAAGWLGGVPDPSPGGFDLQNRRIATDTARTSLDGFVTGLSDTDDWNRLVNYAQGILTQGAFATLFNSKFNGVSEVSAAMHEAVDHALSRSKESMVDGTEGTLTIANANIAAPIIAATNRSAGAGVSHIITADTYAHANASTRINSAEDKAVAISPYPSTVLPTVRVATELQAQVLSDNSREQAVLIIDDFITNIAADITTILASAQAAAESAANHISITNARDAFEVRTSPMYQRSVNRYASGFADINASNSSAFFIGMAMMESDRNQQVSEYDANLSMKMYETGFQAYTQMFHITFQGTLQAHITEFQGKLDLLKTVLGSRVQMFMYSFSEYLKTYMGSLGEMMQTGRTALPTEMQVYQSMIATHADIIKTAMTSHLGGYLGYKGQKESLQVGMLGKSITEMTQMLLNRGLMLKDLTHLTGEIQRMMMVTSKEYYQSREGYGMASATFHLMKWQYFANLIASTDGAAMIPPEVPRWQSVMGGALTGGQTGATVGAGIDKTGGGNYAGWGTLIGAIMGGAAG